MPRITLYEWGGPRHGEISKRAQKFASTATSLQIKQSLVPYFSSKAIFKIDPEKDILINATKPTTPPVTTDAFINPAATLEEICNGKKIKKLYFSLTPSCITKNTIPIDTTSSKVTEKEDVEDQEEEEEKEQREGETKTNKQSGGSNGSSSGGGGGNGFALPKPIPPPETNTPLLSPPSSTSASSAPTAGPSQIKKSTTKSTNEQTDDEIPDDFRARQEYERKKYTWIRSYIYEESPQYNYRNTIKRVRVDADSVVFDRTGWKFSQHPNERRFGWLFGKRHTATNEIRIHSIYEPPQQGMLNHVLLRPDALFEKVRQLATDLGMDLVGCIRTRPFRSGPYGKGTEGYPTSSEAMFMAAMQSKFDDGRSTETMNETTNSTNSTNTTNSNGDDASNTRGLSFVSLVYAIQFSTSDQTEWNGGLEASQVTSQMVDLYNANEIKNIKGEEYEIGTNTRVFSQVKDPRFPDAGWEWKKQNKFSTMSVHLPIAITSHKSWLRSTKMPWLIENRGDVPSKHTFKNRLEQFNTSMLDFFLDFHFLIWLLEHHNEIGLSQDDLNIIVKAIKDGDREILNSFRPKLEALSGIGFRDPYREASSGAPEKAHILAEIITRKYPNRTVAVACPIRSALATTMEDRNAKYINLANDYGRASKKKVEEFCQQHHVEPEEACIAIVGGSKYGGPENALMIWNSLKHGTKAAQELQRLKLKEVQEEKQNRVETNGNNAAFGFSGDAEPMPVDGGDGGGGGKDGSESNNESSGGGENDDLELATATQNLNEEQQMQVMTLLSNAIAMDLAKKSPTDIVNALKRSNWDQNEAVMHLMG